MTTSKKYLKSKPICKVTFKLAPDAADTSSSAYLVGDFNNWNTSSTPMKKLKNGAFTVTLDLEKDREYQYRYLLDRDRWENDWEADKYVPTPYGADNSVVIL
jgi:1,4-alpha-glucan branching enzyme